MHQYVCSETNTTDVLIAWRFFSHYWSVQTGDFCSNVSPQAFKDVLVLGQSGCSEEEPGSFQGVTGLGVSQWCSLLGSSSYFYPYICWKCGDMSLMCEISMTKPWFFSLFLQVSTVQPLFMGFGVQPTCLIHSGFHRWNSSVLLVVELPIKQADLSHIPKIFPEVWDGRVPGNLRPFLQKYFTSFDWETRRKGIGEAWEQWKKRGMQMNEGKKMGNIPSGYLT